MQEGGAVDRGAKREAGCGERPTVERSAQPDAPVLRREPQQCRNRRRDQAVLVKSGHCHDQDRRLRRLFSGTSMQEPGHRGHRHRKRRQVRVVDADIAVEEADHGGDEPQAGDGRRKLRSSELPNAGADRDRGRERMRPT